MRQGSSIYNVVSVIFLILTLVICLLTVVWVSDTVAVPDFLAPSTDIPLPPTRPNVTWTPSATVSVTPSPRATWTVEPSPTPPS